MPKLGEKAGRVPVQIRVDPAAVAWLDKTAEGERRSGAADNSDRSKLTRTLLRLGRQAWEKGER